MPIAVIENGLAMEHQVIGEGIGLAQVLGNNDEERPLHCGSYTMAAGSETTTDYPCTIFSLVLEGEYTMEDLAKPGEIRKLKVGDIFRADKGSSAKWTSPTGGKSFYVIQLPGGTDPTPYFKE